MTQPSLPRSKYWSAFSKSLQAETGAGVEFRWPRHDLTCEANWPTYLGAEKNYDCTGTIQFGPGGNYGRAVAELVAEAMRAPSVKFLVVNCHPFLRLGLYLREIPNIILADVSLTSSEFAINPRQISLPSLSLLPKNEIRENALSTSRPILASFQGTSTHRSRIRLTRIASDRIVINVFRVDWPIDLSAKERLRRNTLYSHLLSQSVFSIVPRGHALFSYRLAEVLECGSIPVFIADQWVPPLHRIIDWGKCSLTFGEGEILQIPRVLSAISPKQIAEMQNRSRQAYKMYFSSPQAACAGVLEEMRQIKIEPSSHDSAPVLVPGTMDWAADIKTVAGNYEGRVAPKWVLKLRALRSEIHTKP